MEPIPFALKALFSSTLRVKVLSHFFFHPGEEFYVRQLAAALKASVGTVGRELIRLAAGDILTSRPVGNQKHYTLQEQSPILDDLRNLFLKTAGASAELRRIADRCVEVLKDSYQVTRVYLIGSLVTGLVHERSDIDLVVEGLSPDRYLKALADLWDLLPAGVELNLIPYEDAYETLQEKSFKEGELLYG